MIFLDQPVNVGFSYSSDNSTVDNTPDAAEDVWAFLQLFLAKYPEYASAPFHIAAESYGGTYGPHVGSVIHKHNKELASASPLETNQSLKTINLASIVIANGHTEPLTQFASIPDYICDGPYALLESNGTACKDWRKKVPTCERLVQTCYDFDTPLTCIPAVGYCWGQIWNRMIREYGLLIRKARLLTHTCKRSKGTPTISVRSGRCSKRPVSTPVF